MGEGKLGKIITFILIVVILLGAIGFLAYNTENFTEEVKTFYVECDGKQVMKSSDGFKMTKEELQNKVQEAAERLEHLRGYL